MTIEARLDRTWRNYPPVDHTRAVDILQRLADGYTYVTVAEYAGMTVGELEAFVRRMRGSRVKPWRPRCMTGDELASWSQPTSQMQYGHDRACRPCDDCTVDFASENRAAGTCNGSLPWESA
jgi:hypothetical protein